MGKEYAVQGALAICQFGASPGILKVSDNTGVYLNGKRAATTHSSGDTFQPPGFGVCHINPSSPKPCTPSIVAWTDFYEGMSINNDSFPLTETSKATCAMGCPNCISLQTTGQIAIPGIVQFKQAAMEHQTDLNPMGTNEESKTPILIQVQWKDAEGKEVIDELPADGIVSIYAETKNTEIGDSVDFTINLENGNEVTLTGTAGNDGWVEIKDINLNRYIIDEGG
ncbi:PAAR-like protein [Porphyromonas macacae]|uniref:PAAR-like protein n=1 Tax=Porphyromonas macacae TaxID=28115 RepID=UPI0024ACE413|nr:PAAR-like protein [Porphyromonas macacae]